jgi:hypothetical protein
LAGRRKSVQSPALHVLAWIVTHLLDCRNDRTSELRSFSAVRLRNFR